MDSAQSILNGRSVQNWMKYQDELSGLNSSTSDLLKVGNYLAKSKDVKAAELNNFQLIVNERSQRINTYSNLLRTVYESAIAIIRNLRL